eukprot:11499225-Heterocapsa_arctica.AAC.1
MLHPGGARMDVTGRDDVGIVLAQRHTCASHALLVCLRPLVICEAFKVVDPMQDRVAVRALPVGSSFGTDPQAHGDLALTT